MPRRGLRTSVLGCRNESIARRSLVLPLVFFACAIPLLRRVSVTGTTWLQLYARNGPSVACRCFGGKQSAPCERADRHDLEIQTTAGRRHAMLVAGSASALAQLPVDLAHAESATSWPALKADVVVPLRYCGGGFCLQASIDGSLFRAVLDTGSPFALVSSCSGGDCSDYCNIWGCASQRFGQLVSINDSTIFYAAGKAEVTWRQAPVKLGGVSFGKLTIGLLKEMTSLSGNGGGTFFGVLPRGLKQSESGGAAVPSFLEQTSSRTLEIDLIPGQEQLLLSTKALPAKAAPATSIVPLVDLQKYGAPVQYYAAEVSSLTIGEEVIENFGRIIAVIDTGTTGLVLPSELYQVYVSTRRIQGRRLNNRRAAAVEIGLAAEQGDPVRFNLTQGSIAAYGGASFDIVTPLPVPDGMVEEAAALWAGGDVGMPPGAFLQGNIARQMGASGLAVRGEKALQRGQRYSVRVKVCRDEFCELAIGLGPIPMEGNLGEMQDTCAYTQRGRMLFAGDSSEKGGPRLKTGDLIECGLTSAGEVYWEVGGKRFGQAPFNTSKTVYPWVAMAGAEIEFVGPGNTGLTSPQPPSDRPFVIFMGLGFFLGRRLRIDTVGRRAAFD